MSASDRFPELHGIFEVIPDLAAPGQVRDGLRVILDDETLEVFWWDRETEQYVDVGEAPVVLDEQPGRILTLIEYASRRVGAILHDPKLLTRPEFEPIVIPMMRIAMERDRLHRDLNAKIDQLRASRQRLVEASEAERRRLERNLHDGAQQRLVVALLGLRTLEAQLRDDQALEPIARAAREELDGAIGDLRELARGVHPPLLASHGLEAAVRAGASRSSLPVEVDVQLDAKLPPAVEEAAYYVAAEAVTNAVKHARASRLAVRIAHDGAKLTVEVRDDGVGGAAVAGDESTGLAGMFDRVDALDGTLAIESPPGGGTTLVAVFPVTTGPSAQVASTQVASTQ